MAHYLIEVGYTPESWASQIDSQANVVDRITPAVKAAKGKIVSVYYAFGESDLVGILDFPTPEDAGAFGLAVTAGGALRSYRTTPLAHGRPGHHLHEAGRRDPRDVHAAGDRRPHGAHLGLDALVGDSWDGGGPLSRT